MSRLATIGTFAAADIVIPDLDWDAISLSSASHNACLQA